MHITNSNQNHRRKMDGLSLQVILYRGVVVIMALLSTVRSIPIRAYGNNHLSVYAHIRCTRRCPYGFETDVEGLETCKCYDPCAQVHCFGGTTCVVVPVKHCTQRICRPNAACKGSIITPRRQRPKQKQKPLADLIQNDSTGMRFPNSIPAVSRPHLIQCSVQFSNHSQKCDRKKKRWYFDKSAGKCKRFRGCELPGNDFARRKQCKRQCSRKKSRKGKNRRKKKKNRKGGRRQRKLRKLREQNVKSRTAELRASKVETINIFEQLEKSKTYYTAACLPGVQMVTCLENPCTTCKDSSVICEVNLCGYCGANYFDRKTGYLLEECRSGH